MVSSTWGADQVEKGSGVYLNDSGVRSYPPFPVLTHLLTLCRRMLVGLGLGGLGPRKSIGGQ